MTNRAMRQPLELKPNPDPSERTEERLLREVDNLKDNVETRLSGNKDVIETRLGGMDKAITIVAADIATIPGSIHDAVDRLQELHGEKFASIAIQFSERDKRTEQLSEAVKTAIAAALQAQKEAATAQNEANTTTNNIIQQNFKDQLATISTLIASQTKAADEKSKASETLYLTQTSALGDKHAALEKRLDLKDGQSTGAQNLWAYIMGGIMAAIAAGALTATVISLVLKK